MILLVNKKANHEYAITKTYQAGVMLQGGEVKSLRHKSGSLNGSFVKVIGHEAFLLNAQITPYQYADNRDYDPKRTRKLLLKKHELVQLVELSAQKGLTLVPLSFELQGRHIKLNVGVGRGKKLFEKRAELKKRVVTREAERAIKDAVRIR